MWRCASISPGMTVLPPALMVVPPAAAGAVAETETILPSRTTTVPRSMTRPVPSRILPFVIVRFCAKAPQALTNTSAAAMTPRCDLVCICTPGKASSIREIGDGLLLPFQRRYRGDILGFGRTFCHGYNLTE